MRYWHFYLLIGLVVFFACNTSSTNRDIAKLHLFECYTSDSTKLDIQLLEHDSVISGIMRLPSHSRDSSLVLIADEKTRDTTLRLTAYNKLGDVQAILILPCTGNTATGEFYKLTEHKPSILTCTYATRDTVVKKPITDAAINYSGQYQYSFGTNQYSGILELVRIHDSHYVFSLLALGRGEAPPIAAIEADTIVISGSQFTYKHKSCKNCVIKVRLNEKFCIVNYLQAEDCYSAVGNGASLAGNFIKISKLVARN
ncbi:MAG: hypothetical protein RL660_2580 [Bacteroidota bacterium]|jgi:hypothetical protein